MMRSNNVLLGVIAALAVALIVSIFAFHGGGGGGRDGNPIGYDVSGTPTGATPTAMGQTNCLANNSCKSIAIHYVRTPPGACPSPVPTELSTALLCTNSAHPLRTLPPCPAKAQCIMFVSKPKAGELTVLTQDDEGFRPFPKTDGEGMIIFQP